MRSLALLLLAGLSTQALAAAFRGECLVNNSTSTKVGVFDLKADPAHSCPSTQLSIDVTDETGAARTLLLYAEYQLGESKVDLALVEGNRNVASATAYRQQAGAEVQLTYYVDSRTHVVCYGTVGE